MALLPRAPNVRRLPVSALVRAGLVLAFLVIPGSGRGGGFAAAELTEVRDFGANPGDLRMWKYEPAGLRRPAPLVVALHGCSQTAEDYARDSGWMALADRYGFALLLPEQALSNNVARCFNWYSPEDIVAETGEAASIRAMVTAMSAGGQVTRGRVHVTGLSAGGAMSAVLAALYPDVFRSAGIVAGVPYGCADGVLSATRCMAVGRDLAPAEWAERVRIGYQLGKSEDPADPTAWPRISVWQGEDDSVVDPDNARELAQQWTAMHGLPADTVAPATVTEGRLTREVWRGADGTALVELTVIAGMGHAQPIDPGQGPSQCGAEGWFMADVDVCAADHLARFFELKGPPDGAAGSLSVVPGNGEGREH